MIACNYAGPAPCNLWEAIFSYSLMLIRLAVAAYTVLTVANDVEEYGFCPNEPVEIAC